MTPPVRTNLDISQRRVVFEPPLNDTELEAFCLQNGNAQVERTREGAIHVNPPTGLLTSDGNSEIIWQLRNWWNTHGQGRVFDSNCGFFLPDGSLMSPDAAYLTPQQLMSLSKNDLSQMARLCPAFVIELLSASDNLQQTRKKMLSWIENGAKMAWLIDPYQRCAYIYSSDHQGPNQTRTKGMMVNGTDPIQGFTLDLARVWRCYEV